MKGSTDGTGGAGGAQPRRPHGLHPGRFGPPATAAEPTGRRTVLDTLRVAVVMLDTGGRVVLWSPLAAEMLGWSGEDVVGRRVGGLLAIHDPEGTGAGVGEGDGTGTGGARHGSGTGGGHGTGGGRDTGDGDRPGDGGDSAAGRARTRVPGPGLAERLLAELLRTGRWTGDLTVRHRDGHPVEVEARASLLVDGDARPYVLASLTETGRLRALEHELAALDALFDSSPLGVAVFDTALRYVRLNEALARLNGLPLADHLGRQVTETLGPGTGGEILAVQKEVLATGRPVIDYTVRTPTGEWRSVSYHRLTDRGGRVLGVSCTVMDVTARQRAQAHVERARQHLGLLNDVGSRLSDLLDVRRIAQTVAGSLVPRFADYSGVLLHASVPEGADLPGLAYSGTTRLLQLGVGRVRRGPDVDRLIGTGTAVEVTRESVFGTVLHSGRPELVDSVERLRAMARPGAPGVRAALALGVHSLLVAPLRARGVVLGLLVVARTAGREPFDRDDLALAIELADRSGAALDNARLYAREREGALMLQRSLLPQEVPETPGVELAFRYVPASSGAAAGGDWFDVIQLAGGRVALVVGDVMGHGLRAAATMGRLRTAVRTLAGLDLAPDELLRRISELGDDLAQIPAEGWMATCVYAVYDPSTRRCTLARAGHLPPVLVVPEPPGAGAEGASYRTELVAMPAGVPLGVAGGGGAGLVRGPAFEPVEVEVPDGALLVLYTDGLVEARGEDIMDGLDRLRRVLCRPHGSLEDACDGLLAAMAPGREPDDVALLMARLGGLPAGSTAAWTFGAEPGAVRAARRHVRETLGRWGLEPLTDTTVLLVSELVTNSLRYAHGPIGVRMVRGTSLLVEVSDPLPDPPRERAAGAEDEGGRGLQLVARASRRWGTRHGPLGKTVWFELALPG